MAPLSNNPHIITNPHIIGDLAREHYNDLRREADAWRLARVAQEAKEVPCISAESRLARAFIMLRLRLVGTPRAQVVMCS